VPSDRTHWAYLGKRASKMILQKNLRIAIRLHPLGRLWCVQNRRRCAIDAA
jgi:hypothetical protein